MEHGAGRAARGEFRLNAPGIAPRHKIVPTPSAADTCTGNGVGGQLPPTAGAAALNAFHQPAVRAPYLKALLTPAKPRQTPPRRPTPIVSSTGCFRCLASDHLVRDCRDPVRCRNCRGCGHRFSSCPMPIARVLTPMPRHHQTVPITASRGTVRAVPFFSRSTTPPPPPPPTPRNATFDPLTFIASAIAPGPNAPPAPQPALTNVPALLFHVAASLAALRTAAAPPPTTTTPPPTPPPAEVPPNISSPLAPVPGNDANINTSLPPAEHIILPAAAGPEVHSPNPPLPSEDPDLRGRRGRRPRASGVHLKPKRQSSRLAAKATASFVSVADKAIQHTALKNSLVPCSAALKEQVEKKGLLNHSKIPISVTDLRRLVRAAGLGCAAASAIGAVPSTAT